MRAREINDYYNQLGEGLGKIVPPQVTSVSRKPLSISLEEIEAGKIRAVPKPPEEDAEAEAEAPRSPTPRRRAEPPTSRAAGRARPSAVAMPDRARRRSAPTRSLCPARPPRRARRHRRDRRVQGGRGLPPAGRRRRARRRPCSPTTPCASSARSRSRRWRRSRRARRCSTGPSRSRTRRLGQTRRPGRRRARHRQGARQVRARHLRRPPHRHAARDAGAGACSRRRCTPRCGSTPRSRRTSPRCARRGVHVVDPEEGRLAGGDVGAGRLADPERIVAAAADVLAGAGDLAGVARAGHRGRHPRADRPGALHRQPVVREDGLRGRRGRRPARRRRHARHHDRAARRRLRRRDRARWRRPRRCSEAVLSRAPPTRTWS